jgi:hypothetical protein
MPPIPPLAVPLVAPVELVVGCPFDAVPLGSSAHEARASGTRIIDRRRERGGSMG